MFWTWMVRRAALALGFTLALLPSAARAEIQPEAQAVIDRYVEVTGGSEAAESLHTLRMRSSISAMAFAGTLTVITRRPHFRTTTTTLGPFTMSDGYDGEHAWRTDPTTGKLVMLDGQDLENAVGNTYFDNEMWLMPDHGGGRIEIAAAERNDRGAYIVLEVTPPHGRSRRLWFNTTTGLLDRMVMKVDQQTIISELTGYRSVAGHMVPFHSRTEIEGMPANTMIAQVDSVWTNENIPDERFAPPGATVEPVRYLRTPGVATMTADYSARHVWLRAAVGDQPAADFILDTGASITVLDSAYAASIGIETMGQMQGQGAGAVGSASFAVLPTLRVEGRNGDGVELHDVKVAVLSVNTGLAPFFWRDIAGIIGYDVISRFVTEVDYDGGTVTFYQPNGFVYQGEGEAVPFTLAGTMPAVHMKIDGAYEGEFRVDVGSSATVDLHRPFVDRYGLRDKLRKSLDVVSGGFGGTFVSQVARMKHVAIGPFGWDGPIVSLSGARTGALASEDYAGNIGNGILERFKCTFDYERRTLYLDPGKRYRGPDPFTRLGAQLARYGDQVQAVQILDGSPAHRAGLRQGDVVVAIDGTPATDYTPQKLRVLFEDSKRGTKVSMKVDRDGKTRTLKITLEDIL